jgi:hypothetical protein
MSVHELNQKVAAYLDAMKYTSEERDPSNNWAGDDAAAMWLVKEALTTDLRTTLYSPGAFTDEGLGGGSTDEPWRCSMQWPNPPCETWEDREKLWDEGRMEIGGYSAGATAALAICNAWVNAQDAKAKVPK